jgi:hypothetical protein
LEKAKEEAQPKVRTRAKSQPVLPISTAKTPQSPSSSTPRSFSSHDSQQTDAVDTITLKKPSTSLEPYLPSSAQSNSNSTTNNTYISPTQPQPQPQPQPQHVYQTSFVTANTPTTQIVAGATLSANAKTILAQVWDQILQSSFNRDGYIILLQYLLADVIPNTYTNDSQRQFNLQFQSFTQSINNQRNNLPFSEQRLWSDNLALTIASNIFGLYAYQGLAQQIDFSGHTRQQIANWMPANFPKW